MRVMLWHRNLIRKTGTKSLNDPSRRVIVWVAGNRHGIINCSNERRNGTTSLERVTVTAKRLANLEAEVPGTNSDRPGVTDTKIDVTDIGTVRS